MSTDRWWINRVGRVERANYLGIYTQFIRFMFPLVLTVIAQSLGRQVLNGGMARMPQATETLASFGLAWGLVAFLTSALAPTRQMGLVLVDGRRAFSITFAVVLLAGLLLSGVLIGLALTPLGDWVIEELHGVHPPLSVVARQALLWLVPMPVLNAVVRFCAGLLIRVRRTDVVSYGILGGIVANVVAVFALLPLGFIQQRPIRLPLLVTYVGLVVELIVILWGCRRCVRHLLAEAGKGLSLADVIRFFWPLALIMAIQGLSRPLINLFVSRGPDGARALAVLTVVYPLGLLPYGWLNEFRNLLPAFQDRPGFLRHTRRFVAGCGLLSFSIMLLLYWTPARVYILETLIGVDPGLALRARAPLMIFSFFPLAVMVRAYFHGVGLVERRTKAMAPSAPMRIGAILVALAILPTLGVHGEARGVAALLTGFVIEALTVWWGVRGRGYTRLVRERRRA